MASPHVVADLDFLRKINVITKKPESFLGIQESVAKEITSLLKSVYDYTKAAEGAQTTNDALPELIIQDFDEEQIWQELELQNDFKINSILSDVAKLVVQKEKLVLSLITQNGNKDSSDEDDENNADEWGNDDNESPDNDDEDMEIEDEDDEDFGLENGEFSDKRANIFKNGKTKLSRPKKRSIVDDTFFKLDDLNTYLEQEDRRAAAAEKDFDKSDDDEASENESIDLFQNIDEDDDDDGQAKYSDFFQAPEDMVGEDIIHDEIDYDNIDPDNIDHEDESEQEDVGDQTKKKVRFDLMNDDQDETSVPSEAKSTEIKSNFETRQDRLKKKIGHLESEAMSEKPWQLKGEVGATSRPQNSLLEEVVEFDMTTRPAPIITEQTTMKLEDLIVKRIRENVWDDVIRQVKTAKIAAQYKKALVLNQEKSKESLSNIYEQEFLQKRSELSQKKGTVEEIEIEAQPKTHIAIRELMTSLFAKLDALSNYHFTPKPAAPELRIISNIPAINMEEVAPVATTTASQLAPEEVKAKPKGDVISKQERTATDKKRERRQKKMMQRHVLKQKGEREELSIMANKKINKKSDKLKNKKLIKKITRNKRAEKMVKKKGAKTTKSSKAFFGELQDKVTRQGKSKHEKKNKDSKLAKSFKL